MHAAALAHRSLLRRLPAVLLAGLLTACGQAPGGPSGSESPGPALETTTDDGPWFSEVSAQAGLDFVHHNGMRGTLDLREVMGAGVALLDYDGDGDLDVFLVQGASFPLPADAPPATSDPGGDRLFRNEVSETGGLRFTDVTAEVGLARDGVVAGNGMGVAVGDYDGDGRPDIYVTRDGPNSLLHNEGVAGFRDTTVAAGAGDPRWSVPAVFFDFDRDGWLDLFIGNYVEVDPARIPDCRDLSGTPDYCGPAAFPPAGDTLLRNLGDGRFADVTAAAGLGGVRAPALGAVSADLDGDGWLDLYVANDGEPNHLWINQGDGTFREEGMMAGVAVNQAGQAEASMGVDAGDFDGDGDDDLFMTHLTKESNTLYVNEGGGLFRDATPTSGLGAASMPFTAFGTAWIDVDNDGWLDLFVANGGVTRIPELVSAGDPYPLHQPNQLFRNLGEGRFADVGSSAGPAFALSEVSRGAAFGDLDNDGDVDVVVSNNNGPARLLRNDVGHRRSWLGADLRTGEPAVPAIGARAAIVQGRAARLWRRVRAEGSYGSANDPRILFGLGSDEGAQTVLVIWPDGRREEFAGLELGRYHALVQGHGRAAAAH